MPPSTSQPLIPEPLPILHPPEVAAPYPPLNTLPLSVPSHPPSPLHPPSPFPTTPSCCSFSCYITCTQHLCMQNDLPCFQEGGTMQYLGVRWLGDAEPMYYIFHFHTHKEWPPMKRLPIHLHDKQLGFYDPAKMKLPRGCQQRIPNSWHSLS
jgi:hypothetical protein